MCSNGEKGNKRGVIEIKLETENVNRRLSEYAQIRKLIGRAFPKNEQFPMWLLRFLAVRKNIDFLAYYDGETFCGITYTVQNENMVFVLYLAVNDVVRSKGYGSAILAHLKTLYGGKALSLNVEPLEQNAKNYTQRVKRIEFYKRNGFERTDYFVVDKSEKYLILSTEKYFSIKNYQAVLKYLSYGLYMPKIKMNTSEK